MFNPRHTIVQNHQAVYTVEEGNQRPGVNGVKCRNTEEIRMRRRRGGVYKPVVAGRR